MKFIDYTFNLLENGTIVMDEELSAISLNVKHNDIFKAEVIDNKVVFKKQPPAQIWEQD
jgi:hypothetical protein